MVESSEFLGTHLNSRVDWSINIQSTCARKGLGHSTYAEQQYIHSMGDIFMQWSAIKGQRSVLGTNSLKVVTERRVLSKLLNIIDTSITRALSILESSCPGVTLRDRKSFLSTVISLYTLSLY